MSLRPDEVVKLARKHFGPPAISAKAVAGWIAELDHDDGDVREKAFVALEKLGVEAEPMLRQALRGEPEAETRRRANRLLGKLPAWRYTEERVRASRVLALLERLDGREARGLLEEVAKSHIGFWLGDEATASLGRMHRR